MARTRHTTSILVAFLLTHHAFAATISLPLINHDLLNYTSDFDSNTTTTPFNPGSIWNNQSTNASNLTTNTSSTAPRPNTTTDPESYIPKSYTTVRVIHATLASTAWLILFPLGSIIPRLRRDLVFPLHAGIQMFAYAVFAAAAGMGIWMAKNSQQLTSYHPLIGLSLLSLLAIQPLTESLNAIFYNPARHDKIIVLGHIHIWLGRALLAAGIINGGLGFVFSASLPWNNEPALAARVVYAVVACLVVGVYAGVLGWERFWRRRGGKSGGEGEMEGLRVESSRGRSGSLVREGELRGGSVV